MANITTNWTNIQSKSATIGPLTVTFYLEARYSSQSQANNTSTVYTRLRSVVNSGSGAGAGYSYTCSYCSPKSGRSEWRFKTETILSSSAQTITHNADGNKSLSLSATAKNNYLGINVSLSGTAVLPKINRVATLLTFTGSDIESNFSATYTNYVESYTNNLLIQLDNTTIQTQSNYISGTTFTLGTSAINSIKTYMNNNHVSSVKLIGKLETMNGSTRVGYSSSISIDAFFLNAKPTLSAVFTEKNSKVITMLGSSSANTIIENVSQIEVKVTPSSPKSVAITNVSVNGVNATQSGNVWTATLTGLHSKDFRIVVTDNWNQTNDNPDYTRTTFINYTPVNINSLDFHRLDMTSSTIVLNSEIGFQQQIGSYTNNITKLIWKVEQSGTEHSISATPSSNKITITNYNCTDAIPYSTSGNMYLVIEDRLTSDSESQPINKSVPTFEAGSTDFQVNGDLFIATTERTEPINVRQNIEKNMILARLESNKTISATNTYEKLTLSEFVKVGNKLNITNGNIVVDSSVKHIKVSYSVRFNNGTNGSKFATLINKDGNQAIQTSGYMTTRLTLNATDTLFEVENGETLSLEVYGTANDVVTGNNQYYGQLITYIYVEVID